MKKIALVVSLLFMGNSTLKAQNASISWGDEFKLKKGTTDLEVIYADKTGVFVKESHVALKSYFVVGATYRESATLIKLDKSLTEEFRQDFNKELKGKEYERFFFLKNKLFIMASKYNKRDKTLTLYAAELDKKSGELAGEWVEVTSWNKEEKGDDINFNTTFNPDSSRIVTVSSIEGKEKNNYEIKQFDEKLKQIGKTIAITNEFDPKTFQLEDVIYTKNEKVILVGRMYQFEEGKKKKTKFLQFVNYNIRIYNNEGNMIKEITTDISDKWLVSTKVLQVPNSDIVLAAYYSNNKKDREINGMMIQRISPITGEVINTSLKEINTGLIKKIDETEDEEEEDDEETKKEKSERKKLKKLQEDEEGFSKFTRFRNILYTPDSGLVILSERYREYTYSTTSYQGGSAAMGGMRMTTTWYKAYECGNLMMSKIDKSGNISWLNIIPKNQQEVIRIGSNSSFGAGPNFSYTGPNFFVNSANMPFYAGFGILPSNDFITIIFNDHKKNEDVMELGQKVKGIGNFRKSDCFGVKLDLLTGKYTRKYLFSNSDMPIAMPRLGTAIGNFLYIVGKDDRTFGKTKIAIAKISVKK